MSDTRRPRIVMLCGDGPSSWFMYNALTTTADIIAVVVEAKPSARAMLRHRLHKLGWLTVLGQLGFMALNKLLLARSQRPRIEALIHRHGLCPAPAPPAILHRVASINGTRVRALLKKLDPDAVVVNGTRILSRAVLQSVACPFLNTHVGITPRYRGVHGGYWALVSDDADHCGVTVHLVDSGVDTGGVLYQARITVERSDGFNTYPVHQLAAAIPLMQAALRDVVSGTLAPHDSEGPSRQWYHPTLRQYLWNRLVKSVK